MSNQQEMMKHIGGLVAVRRNQLGFGGRDKFAKDSGIGSNKTVGTIEHGLVVPIPRTQELLEKALGWSHGRINQALEGAKNGSITPADVTLDWLAGMDLPQPVNRAAELEDSELLVEVIKRLERWQKVIDQDPPDVTPIRKLTPAQEQWNQFGLAADAVPGIKDRRTKPAPQPTGE